MLDSYRSQGKQKGQRQGTRPSSSFGLGVNLGGNRFVHFQKGRPLAKPTYSTGLFKKPRNWKFQTKPLFKKVKEPLVDIFHEAEEVMIVIDLGGFRRGDISLNMKQEEYSIFAKRGDQEFQEKIALPPEVDIEKCQENFRNGVLEIILPRKKADLS